MTESSPGRETETNTPTPPNVAAVVTPTVAEPLAPGPVVGSPATSNPRPQRISWHLRPPKWQVDTWVSIMAFVVSICALFLTISESRATRELNRRSVAPKLSYRFAITDDSMGIALRNVGLGPAIVKSLQVRVRGGAPAWSWREALDAAFGTDTLDFTEANIYPGQAIPVSERELYLVGMKYSAPLADQINNAFANHLIEIRLCYCSIYGDCAIMGAAAEDIVSYSFSAETSSGILMGPSNLRCPAAEVPFGAKYKPRAQGSRRR